MQYRVAFEMGGGQYFTEWFETVDEAYDFLTRASTTRGVFVQWIENEDEEII